MKYLVSFFAAIAMLCSCSASVQDKSDLENLFIGENGVFSIVGDCPYSTDFRDLGDVVVIRYNFSGEELRNLYLNVNSKLFIDNSIGAAGQFLDGSCFAASFNDSFITNRAVSDNQRLLVFRETLKTLVIAVGLSNKSVDDAEQKRLEQMPLLVFPE